MKLRSIKIIKLFFLVFVLGVLYGQFVEHTGWGIPCLFHELTGFLCPGCGVTSMCIALMHADFKQAYQSNQMLFLTLPLLLYLSAGITLHYIKTGNFRVSRKINICLWGEIILLTGFAFWRNIIRIL